jgi:DNA-binding ferritin-like protein
MLQRLTNLIEANRKAILEAEELEEFYVESLLLEFEKELEKSKWIFYLFSKY